MWTTLPQKALQFTPVVPRSARPRRRFGRRHLDTELLNPACLCIMLCRLSQGYTSVGYERKILATMARSAYVTRNLRMRYAVEVWHDEVEDRLILHCSSSQSSSGVALMTRRITANLLQSLAQLLVAIDSNIRQMPADLQKEALYYAHQSALAQAVSNPASPLRSTAAKADTVFLVTKVNVSVLSDTDYALTLAGAQCQDITMSMSRNDLHCLWHLLQLNARAASWDLPAVANWFEPDQDLRANRIAPI